MYRAAVWSVSLREQDIWLDSAPYTSYGSWPHSPDGRRGLDDSRCGDLALPPPSHGQNTDVSHTRLDILLRFCECNTAPLRIRDFISHNIEHASGKDRLLHGDLSDRLCWWVGAVALETDKAYRKPSAGAKR